MTTEEEETIVRQNIVRKVLRLLLKQETTAQCLTE